MAQPDIRSLLWGSTARPSRGRKPALSVHRIATEAIALADADGLAKLSMKRLADRLGSGVMSLYRYIPAKRDLLSIMLDTALGDPPDIPDPADWRAAVRAWAIGLHDTVMAHPWTQAVLSMNRVIGPNESAWLETELRALSSLELKSAESLNVAMAISSYVLGATKPGLFEEGELEFGFVPGQDDTATRFPFLTGILTDDADPQEFAPVFDFGLERVLDGIEAGRF